jgi:hypothetical protein
MKRGTKIEYRYAAGAIVSGKIIKPYSPEMPGWFLCALTDEGGEYRSGCHVEQLRNVDNRPSFAAA